MKTVLVTLFVIILNISIFSQRLLHPETRGEINIDIKNNYGAPVRVDVTLDSPICWDQYHLIKTDKFPGGSITTAFGIQCNICFENSSPGDIRFGLGNYKITFFENNVEKTHVYIDYRTSTLPVNFSASDIDIDYNYSTKRLYYSYSTTLFPQNGTDKTSIWEEFPTVGYEPTGLIPAAPTDLMQTATIGHPHFQWSHPAEDPDGTFRTGYKIHRCLLPDHDWEVIATVAKNVNSFIDYSYDIGGNMRLFGQPISYYVTAINGTGFESEQTDTVQVKHPSINLPEKAKGQSKQVQVLDYSLSPCYPNPFNPSTKISFTLPETSNLEITVYNSYGQEIQQLFKGFKEKGYYELQFDGKNLSSGVYYYTLKTDKFNESKKMLLIK
jgi:archaellin